MRRSHRSQKVLRQRETRSLLPCARSTSRLSRRSKTGMLALAQPAKRETKAGPTKFSLSCDDAKPFHFPVEPNAINDQRNRSGKRRNRARKINRRALNEVDPDTPRASPEREQRRENDEHNMESFKRHLMNDGVVVPRQKYKPEKSQHKKAGKNQDAVNQALFRGKMHENGRDGARFQRRHQHGNADVGFARPEIDIGKRDRHSSEGEQERAHHQIGSHVLLYAVRVFLVFLGILRNIGRIIHGLEQIKKWEHKYPD